MKKLLLLALASALFFATGCSVLSPKKTPYIPPPLPAEEYPAAVTPKQAPKPVQQAPVQQMNPDQQMYPEAAPAIAPVSTNPETVIKPDGTAVQKDTRPAYLRPNPSHKPTPKPIPQV